MAATYAAQQRLRAVDYGMRGNREERSQSENVAARRASRRAGERNRNQAAGLPLEQEQFHGQQHGRDRSGKCSRHACRGARHQQCFALHAGEMEELGDH
jgi:hypothetical protein